MSKFPAELLDLVFKKIEWHSGLQYIKLLKIDINDPYPVFHFKVNEHIIVINYDEQTCVLQAPGNPKLTHFFYKVDINPFITNNFEEFETLSEYIHHQLKDLFLDTTNIHYGFNVTHFRIKQNQINQIWLVYTLNHDPNGASLEIYIEQEVEVTHPNQKKQILALRSLLQACMQEGYELVNDNAGPDYSKPLHVAQANSLAMDEPNYSNTNHSIAFGEEVPIPTARDIEFIGEVIAFISNLVNEAVENYNNNLCN